MPSSVKALTQTNGIYQISSAQDLIDFATLVNNGNKNVNAKLTIFSTCKVDFIFSSSFFRLFKKLFVNLPLFWRTPIPATALYQTKTSFWKMARWNRLYENPAELKTH